MDKPIEKVLSGDQIADGHGRWNRIHAVRITGGAVSIDHDRKRNVLYRTGTTVQVRSC
ncbi:hypothetical protein ACFCV3_41710 [Kribbella sp. NPDC056345]|uniref:hypothetical protein n=1 Tax=Kribbella sp. NPDC056345 TaxID=3345789 RepID=UPI0035E0F13F